MTDKINIQLSTNDKLFVKIGSLYSGEVFMLNEEYFMVLKPLRNVAEAPEGLSFIAHLMSGDLSTIDDNQDCVQMHRINMTMREKT